MLMPKKLIFAPFFLIVFAILIYQLNPLLKSYDFIFSLSLYTLIQLIILGLLILVTSLLFVLFATIALNWKITLPVGILAAVIPIIFLKADLAIVFFVGTLVSLFLIYVILENSLKTYTTFNPVSLFSPSIRHLSGFLILVICISYFLSIRSVIEQNGFQIPDSLIDTALNLTSQNQSKQTQTLTTQSSLSQEQIDLLRKNPDLLRQSGLDPKILDSLNSPNSSNIPNDLIKQTVKDQLQNVIKPYLGFVPVTLAVILFFLLQSITSILNLLISPLLWITFYILEKTGFIKFTTETRSVKKMLV